MGQPKKGGLFDLKSNYAFYGAYHADGVNKAIHILCVWPILFSAMLLMQHSPPLVPGAVIPLPWGGGGGSPVLQLPLNLAFLTMLLYSLFYLTLEPRAGAVATALVAGCYAGSHALFVSIGPEASWKVALVMQVFCWVAQFLGHGIFEGRAPALLDNLLQAVLMAPFFVLLEVLHSLTSFEPEPGFWKAVHNDIGVQITAFKGKAKTT